MLREKVAKGAWHLSNMANPHSLHPSTSTSELHPKIPPKVTCPLQFLTRSLLNPHGQSLRPDGGITVSVETITEYGPRYTHRVSPKRLLYASLVPYPRIDDGLDDKQEHMSAIREDEIKQLDDGASNSSAIGEV